MQKKVLNLNQYQAEEIMILLGANDYNLKLISQIYDCEIYLKDNCLYTDVDESFEITTITNTFVDLLALIKLNNQLETLDIQKIAEQNQKKLNIKENNLYTHPIGRSFDHKMIYPKTLGQKQLVDSFYQNDIVFVSGPAGTGKTFLAVNYAIAMLKEEKVSKIIITRPVVEAGENLGFLPGDLKEKIDPYLRPIYDSLGYLLGPANCEKLVEKGIIEIAPLAYMRGRTLDNAIIILDEAQNTTCMQMKMFLTRMGFYSKMIITGDISQSDLPAKVQSGFIDAINRLEKVKEIGMIKLSEDDVVRHPLVKRILQCYDDNN